jgi:hypothetical protein
VYRVVTSDIGVDDELTAGTFFSFDPPPHPGERTGVSRHVFERRMKHVERELAACLEMCVRAAQGCQLIVAS